MVFGVGGLEVPKSVGCSRATGHSIGGEPNIKKAIRKIQAMQANFGLRAEYLMCLSPPIDREQAGDPCAISSGRTALARGTLALQVGSVHSGRNASCTYQLARHGARVLHIKEHLSQPYQVAFVWVPLCIDGDTLYSGNIGRQQLS